MTRRTPWSHAHRATSSPAPTVVPGHRFVGTVQAHDMQALVTALACQRNGDLVVLLMTGPKTAVSAIAATLHTGGKTRTPISFEPASTEAWDGPTQLCRMEALGSSWMASAVEPTTHLHVAVLARAANSDYHRHHPIPQPIESTSPPSTAPLQKRLLPPPRYVLASAGATHPDWQTFSGLLRSLWLPFPLSFAPLLWEAGRRQRLVLREDEATGLDLTQEHMLIEPVACTLGIQAWQILPSSQWSTLLEQQTQHACALGL